MANHKSAEKRHRQSLKRRSRNRHFKGDIKSAVKAVRNAIAQKAPAATLETLFRKASSTLQHISAKGIIAKENASRRVGRLAVAIHKATTGA